MEFTQLNQFKTVAETENITEAAKILGISQPALTKSIKNLEAELNVSLFDRINKKLILNDIGKAVLNCADELLDDLEYMLTDFEFVKNNDNLLKICSSINSILTYFIPKFNSEYPNVDTYPQLRRVEKFKSYLYGNIFDVAISHIRLDDEFIKSDVLCKDWVVISVPKQHKLYGKKYLEYEDLDGQEFVCSKEILLNPLPKLFEQALESNGISMRTSYYANTQIAVQESYNTDKLMYLSSKGLKFLNCDSDRMYIPINPNKNMVVTYYISYLKSNKKKSDFFIRWLKDQFDYYSLIIDDSK